MTDDNDEHDEKTCEDCGEPIEEMTEEEEAAWNHGFECGLDSHLEEMYLAATSKGETYVKMIDELFELIELKYSNTDNKQ